MNNEIIKETICRELIKNGYSEENRVRVWDIARRAFRFVNLDMAKAFLNIREHPRYKATIMDIETNLLKENIPKFFKNLIDQRFNLINLSCVDGTKSKLILGLLPENLKLRYCPVNVSEYLVKLSLENVKKSNFKNVIDYAPRVSDDFWNLDQTGAALRNNSYQRNVLLLLGSFLSGFDINDYLFRLNQSMLPGDLLIIGNGIRKGDRFVNLETYKHPMFNNWLIHLIRQLGFKDEEVEYNARFAHNRLEMYYKIKEDKKIISEGRKIEFRKGDEIIVAFQYKLYAQELRDFCDMYFDNVQLFHDPAEEYAIVFSMK